VVQQLNPTTASSRSPRTGTHGSDNRQSKAQRAKSSAPRFAHPAEADIANWFTSNNIAWQYEPTTFPLEMDSAGRLTQSFTPDFYLPDEEIYIEMTTMRQALVTRKNQKFRRMRELYPEKNVRLLYRKDVELIQTWYHRPSKQVIEISAEPRFTSAQIARRVRECADHLATIADGRRVELIPINDGEGFASLLSEALTTPESLGKPSLTILVAGAIGTGISLTRHLRSESKTLAPIIVTLIERPTARLLNVPLTFAGFQVGAEWIVGCHLGGVISDDLSVAAS
jgi:hypothetical protein